MREEPYQAGLIPRLGRAVASELGKGIKVKHSGGIGRHKMLADIYRVTAPNYGPLLQVRILPVLFNNNNNNREGDYMGYSEDDSIVRVDFFKAGGKWYTTEAVPWTGGYDNCNIHEAFDKSLRDHLGDRLCEMDAICLQPYHEHSHPLMVKNGRWRR